MTPVRLDIVFAHSHTFEFKAVPLAPLAVDEVSFANTEELVPISGLPATALIEVGNDHRLADLEPLRKMLEACERSHEVPR